MRTKQSRMLHACADLMAGKDISQDYVEAVREAARDMELFGRMLTALRLVSKPYVFSTRKSEAAYDDLALEFQSRQGFALQCIGGLAIRRGTAIEDKPMTSKPVTGVKLDKATGKLVRKPPRMAAGQRKKAEGKAKRLEKAWRAKSK